MQKAIYIVIVMAIGLFVSCKDTNSNASDTNTINTETPQNEENIENSTPDATKNTKEAVTVYTWVDNLRLRSEPDTNSDIVKELKEGESLLFLGEKSDFTKKVNLRGKLYDEPWLKVETNEGKEGWVYGGAVRFYKPSVDESPSPYDKCFTSLEKRDFEAFQACTESIQAKQIRKDTRFLKPVNNGYELHLLSGKMVKLIAGNNETDFKQMFYRYYLPQMGFFVTKANYEAAGEYILINDKSGKEIPIWGYPKASANARHVVSTNSGLEASKHPNGLQILSFTDNGLEVVFEKETSDEYLPSLPKWLDDKTVEVTLNPKPSLPELRKKVVKVMLSDTGEWVYEE